MDLENIRVGLLVLELQIPDSNSLKAKRAVLRSVKDRLRAHHNVSVSEVAAHDKWQRAVLGVASVGNDAKYLEGQLTKIADEFQEGNGFFLANSRIEIL